MRDRAIARYADDSDLDGQVAQPDHSKSYAEDAKIADREIRARKRLAKRPGKAWKQAK
jgi:hypothetical protein